MTLEICGDDILLLDLPDDFTLPERYPVVWNPEHRSFSVPRRHPSIPSLMKVLREKGLVDDATAGSMRRVQLWKAAPRASS
ncbi:MAG: hypothetical protein ABR599_09530 [Gemmatimonadota bacterium]